MLISNVAATLSPRFVGKVIDLISGGNIDMDVVLWDILIIISLTLFSAFFMSLTRRFIISVSRKIEYDLRKDFFELIVSMPLNFFRKMKTGDLMAFSSNDIAAAREFLGPAVMFGANSISMFALSIYFMIKLDPGVTGIALIPLPVVALLTYILGKKVHFAFTDVQQAFASMTEKVRESVTGIRILRAYARERDDEDNFEKFNKDYYRKNMAMVRIQALTIPVIMVLVGSSLVLVLIFGGRMVINGGLTIGGLAQFFIYLNLLIWPVAALGWIINLIQRASASAARLQTVFEQRITPDSPKKQRVEKIRGNIEFRDIHFRIDPEIPIINGISLNIPEGSSLGITGPVGCGKTILTSLLTGNDKPQEGSVLINDIDINDYDIKSLRNSVSFVAQEPFLFSDTIANNISFGRSDIDRSIIIDCARIAGIHDEIMTFPEAYDTLLGEKGISLSGGQKQRLAIARALTSKPEILILDDAFSAVDGKMESRILENLKNKMAGKTTIIVSHRLSAISGCDNIIYMENGNITESGTNEQLLKGIGKYLDLYMKQKLVSELDES